MANRLNRPERRTGGSGVPATSVRPGGAVAFRRLAARVQGLRKGAGSAWSPGDVMDLLRGAREALDEIAQSASAADNPHALWQTVEATRAQARQLLLSLSPPPEIFESAEFQALLDLLSPHRRAADARSDKPILRGKARSDLLNRQIQEAVAQADRHALAKRAKEPGATTRARSLTQLARVLKKRQNKKGAGEVTGEVEVTREEAEELATLALDVMRALREELAPRWQPAQQPWFVNAADHEVYTIVLGVLPKELFHATQAFAAMQNLRKGDGVFQFRAGDKTSDALKRG